MRTQNMEIFLNRKSRDAKIKQLREEGKKVRGRTLRGIQLHPEYIADAKEHGIEYKTGFGNSDYLRTWGTLYTYDIN